MKDKHLIPLTFVIAIILVFLMGTAKGWQIVIDVLLCWGMSFTLFRFYLNHTTCTPKKEEDDQKV